MLYDNVKDSIREAIYDAVEDSIRGGVSLYDFKRVVAQAWTEIHRERASLAEKEASNWLAQK
jgi:hypothetical protein